MAEISCAVDAVFSGVPRQLVVTRRPLVLIGLLALFVLLPTAVSAQTAGSGQRTSASEDPLAVLREPSSLAGSDRRHVLVRVDRVDVVVGSEVVASSAFPGAGGRSLGALADVLSGGRYEDWVRRSGDGSVEIRAAVVLAPGTRLDLVAPESSTVRLVALPGVFLAADAATLRLDGVTVTSWRPDGGGPATDDRTVRPFVYAGPGAVLRADRSTFAELGSERGVRAAGVVWDGASGGATGSTFRGNLVGVEVSADARAVLRENMLRDNRRHGLLVSAARDESAPVVTAPTEGVEVPGDELLVRGNRVGTNGVHGIVVEGAGERLTLTGNTVENNRSDGVVLTRCRGVTLRGNALRGNELGVRVATGSTGVRLESNRIVSNGTGILAEGAARELRSERNMVIGAERLGIGLDAPASTSSGDRVLSSPVGMEIGALVDVDDLTVTGGDLGVVVHGRGIARLTELDLDAATAGVDVQSGAVVRLERSRIRASQPLTGHDLRFERENELLSSPAASPWFPALGAFLLFLVAVVQLLRFLRNRSSKRPNDRRERAWNAS